MLVRIEGISEQKIMQKTRNPCKTRLESVDNPLIHYFVTLTTASDKKIPGTVIAYVLRCVHYILLVEMCILYILTQLSRAINSR